MLALSTWLALGAVMGCGFGSDPLPTSESPALGKKAGVGGATIHVANVDQLYDAVNDPNNASATIALAAGTYVLAATDGGGSARPNGGRLELQDDMALRGPGADRSAVVIDASGLSVASLTASLGRTGPVRVGRGSNTIEGLTILGSAAAIAGIETDLTDGMDTRIRIANVASIGSLRGIDIRNVGAAMAGRRLEIEITGSEFVATKAPVPNQGLRIVNLNGADGATIIASLRGNRAHDAQFGCLVSNLATSNAVIRVQSSGNQFSGNALGCFINGGIVTAASGVADGNTTTFEAHGDAFVDNTAPSALGQGGILIIGGESPNAANATSRNVVEVRLWGTTVARNTDPQVAVFAARSLTSGGLAGVGNRVRLELGGVSKKIAPMVTPSVPIEPGGTNAVMVMP